MTTSALRCDDVLQVNPRLVAAPVPDAALALVTSAGRIARGFDLPPEAIDLLKHFAPSAAVRDVFPAATGDDLDVLAQALDAELLVRSGAAAPVDGFDGLRLIDWRETTGDAHLAAARTVRRDAVNGRDVLILDDVFPAARIAAVFRWLRALPFKLADYDTAETSDVRHWICEFPEPADALARVPFLHDLAALARAAFPQLCGTLRRAHANCSLYGDPQSPHRDCAGDGLTLLYFGNERWEQRWAGETIFFSSDDEPVAAVAPKPGRVVLFHGEILHRAGVPSRACTDPRVSVALKFAA